MIRKILSLFLCLCFFLSLMTSCGHIHKYDKRVMSEEFIKLRGLKCTDETDYYYSCSCGACGDGKTFKAKGEHDFSKERVMNKYLCTEATTESSAVYYKSCAKCGEKGSETFMYGDKLPMFNNKNILVFGDSYSTFSGMIPSGYDTYYPNLDVNEVGEAWWSLFASKTKSTIVRNDSWSGSTIGYTSYGNADTSSYSSFIYRLRKMIKNGFFEENEVDTVFVFGGTNDAWSNAPLGEMKYGGWTEKDLYNVLPAICHFVYSLKAKLPDATIVMIINSDINPVIQDAMEDAAEYYGVCSLRLTGIDKKSAHPTEKGMKAICDQLMALLNK